jgi:uncharacterized protein (DUF1330 family)
MPAYIVVSIDVHDPERYAEYIEAAPASIASHGGHYVIRNGRSEVLEGDWDLKRFVVLEFPTYEQAKAWHDSADYAPVRAIREETATSRMIVIEGAGPV